MQLHTTVDTVRHVLRPSFRPGCFQFSPTVPAAPESEKIPLGVRLLLGAGKGDLHRVAIADGRAVAARHRRLSQNDLRPADMLSHFGRTVNVPGFVYVQE